MVHRRLQERGLPDSRVTGEQQRPAVTGTAVDEPPDQREIALTADELRQLPVGTVAHAETLRTHRLRWHGAEGVI